MTTEVAPTATLPILSHWIAGRPVEVLPEQTGPVYNPATGPSSPASRAAGVPRSTRPWPQRPLSRPAPRRNEHALARS
jgi:hypothetical protein